MDYAIFNAPVSYVYSTPYPTRMDGERRVSTVADEALYGSVVRVVDVRPDGWVYQMSAYGYGGYVRRERLIFVDESGAREYLARSLKAVRGHYVDVLGAPTVHGEPLLYLPENALVEPLEDTGSGWTLVRLADGSTGFIPTGRLKEKRFGEDFLYADLAKTQAIFRAAPLCFRTAQGGREDFSLQAVLEKNFGGSEDAFRAFLVADAMSYLGTQYRWGGRCSFGIDCSGLTYTVYSDAGILIYRDAVIADGYTMRRLPVEFPGGKFDPASLHSQDIRPGDTLYFPGHIAMYIGGGEYIHSTAHAGSDGVVINSLVPTAPNFRRDLLEILHAFGGVR